MSLPQPSWRTRIIVGIAYPLLSTIFATMRVRHYHRERWANLKTGSILCGLHARGIVAAFLWKRLGLWVMVSLSRDGELQNKLFTNLGYRTVRGSTSRGGVKATIEAIRLLRSGRESLIIAVDGPRGPRGKIVQEGALLMARKSGAALMPVGVSCNPRKNLRTWDNYTVPLPFSKCAVVYGEPIYVPEHADDAAIAAIKQRLQEAIHAAEAEANALSGYQPFPHQDLDPS